MMELPLIDFDSLKSRLYMYESYQADILVADLNSQDVFLNDPVRVNALQVLLVLEGSIDLSIDYVLFQASTNTVVTIMPTHITKVMKYSPNFKGRLMAVSRAFLEQSMMPNHSSSMIQYMKIRKNPTILLQESEIKTLDESMLRLRQTILQTSHHLQRLLIQNTLMGFFIEMGNIFSERKEYNTPPLFPLDGLGSLLLGGWLLLMPNFFVNILMYLLGAVLVLAGIQQISTLIRARKWSVVPYGFYILPSLILLVGVMILVYPMDIMANTLTIFGVATLFYGANELINWYKFRKRDYIQID